MISLCLSVVHDDTRPAETGFVLMLLRPADKSLLQRLSGERATATWQRYDQRFACRRYAMHRLRQELRTGRAAAARLYHGGTLHGYWQRDLDTGREVRLPVDSE